MGTIVLATHTKNKYNLYSYKKASEGLSHITSDVAGKSILHQLKSVFALKKKNHRIADKKI